MTLSCRSALRHLADGGESSADHLGQYGGVADGLADVLETRELLAEGGLPDGEVLCVGSREVDGVLCDVADEERVAVREVVLELCGSLAPVLGHEVNVEFLDRVQREEPAEERRDVAERAAAEQLEGQVQPQPLASVVGVPRNAAVDVAVEDAVELLVPEVVDQRRDGDHQVEVVAVGHEAFHVGILVENAVVVGGEVAQVTSGRTEEVDLSGFGAQSERARDVVQVEPGVHVGLPFGAVRSSPSIRLVYLLCLRYKMRFPCSGSTRISSCIYAICLSKCAQTNV